MTASNPPGSSFYIVPYSSLIRSTDVVERPDDQGRPEPINPTIARLIKAVQDNPTPKADE